MTNNFNFGNCSEFAEVLLNTIKYDIPEAQFGLIRGLVKMDDFEEYGDIEWEDCHAVVMINDKYYLDSTGLHKFDKKDKSFSFSNETLNLELIPLTKINKYDYSIYREYESLPISIHATFNKIKDNGKLAEKEINFNKEKAEKHIESEKKFFQKEILAAIKVNKIKDEDLLKIYHGDNFDTSKIKVERMYHSDGNLQEGIGVYFGNEECARGYGKNIVSAYIDKEKIVDSRASIEDILSIDQIAIILNKLHQTDNEPLYYYLTDFGVELSEPEDVEFQNFIFLAEKLSVSEVRNFQIDLCQKFPTKDVVEIWREVTGIDGTFNEEIEFYAIVNTDIKLKKESKKNSKLKSLNK